MYIVHVFIHVKPACVEEFKAATLANVQNSLREEGIARFDFLEQQDDPTRFVLVEAYRQPEDADKHKQTPHYALWKETVSDMMAEPRSSIKYSNLSPVDSDW